MALGLSTGVCVSCLSAVRWACSVWLLLPCGLGGLGISGLGPYVVSRRAPPLRCVPFRSGASSSLLGCLSGLVLCGLVAAGVCFGIDQPGRAASSAPHGHPYNVPEISLLFC